MGLQARQQVGHVLLFLGHAAEGIMDDVLPQQGVEHVAHAGGQHVELVAAFEYKKDAPAAQRLGVADQLAGDVGIAAQAQPSRGQRIVPVGVEAGRDEQEVCLLYTSRCV